MLSNLLKRTFIKNTNLFVLAKVQPLTMKTN